MTMTLLTDPVSELTRRRLLTGAGALGILSVMPASAWGQEAAGEFPVTVRHAYGETTIAERPARVVSVGFNDHDFIVALGVIPVGVAEWFDDYPTGFPWVLERYGDTPPGSVGLFYELNFEKVAALRPDLIIGVSSLDEAAYQTLSRIAPTVATPPGYTDATPPREEIQLMIGRALGLQDRAEELNAQVEARFAAAREAHPEFEGKTAVVAEYYPGTVRVRGSAEVWSSFLTALGFEVPADIVGLEFREFSGEQVDVLADLDALVWNFYTPEDRPALEDNPIYPRLDVAREGRAILVGPEDTISEAIGHNSALSLPLVLEALVPRLAAAADGDPATVAPS
ncbi:MAG: iron-siderophore ABC transporter substrate-binding protein [Egibacteraceae bacterium]